MEARPVVVTVWKLNVYFQSSMSTCYIATWVQPISMYSCMKLVYYMLAFYFFCA